MPPIRADHGLSWRKGNPHGGIAVTGGDGDERAKQPRRNTPLPKRHSPSHSRTPSPNQQAPSSVGMATVHATTHGHVYAHGGTRRSPSSKAPGNSGGSRNSNSFPEGVSVGGPREKKRASPDPTRKGYAHAHSQRSLGNKSPAFGPPFKGSSARGTSAPSWGVSSSPPAGLSSGRTGTSPTPPVGSSSTTTARGHSPILCRGSDATDAQTPVVSSSGGGHSSGCLSSAMPLPPAIPGGGSGSVGAALLPLALDAVEVREMTPLDRVFLEQPHEGRKDVEDDDLHLCNEIQRHLQSRVQSQQSQLMEATNRNNSSNPIPAMGLASANNAGMMAGGGSAIGGSGSIAGSMGRGSTGSSGRARAGFGVAASQHNQGQFSDHFAPHEMELINDDESCYSSDALNDDGVGSMISDPMSKNFTLSAPSSSRRSAATATSGGGVGGGQTGSGGYASPVSLPVVGGSDMLDDRDLGSSGVPPVSPSSGGGPAQGLALDVGVPMDYLLDGTDGRASAPRELRGGPGSRSPLGSALAPDVQMSEAGGDGQLREVVSGLDAMDLDDVDRALALLTAQKERIIAKQYAGVVAAASARPEAHSHAAVVPPQPPPQPAASNGGSSSSRNGSGRQRRSSGRSRHGSEGSPSAGGRSEAFGVSGGGVRGAPTSFSRVPRVQGRPPPVPGHLSASTAAMRRSSPGSIASLAELDSYLEHHHRRLVEQVEGGVGADDVEAEIKASRRHPRRGTRSHQRFGSGPGSSNGLGSSSSSNSVPRTVGARVSTGSFFHSTLSADGGDGHGHRADWKGKGGGRSGVRDWSPQQRGPGYKRERGELRGGGSDGGWGANLREFRGGGDSGEDRSGSAFMGVSATTHTTTNTNSQTWSPPPSIMSSDDVSVSSYGRPVTVQPGSPNNLTFAGRPPPSLAKIRLEAVRSLAAPPWRGVEDGPMFTSPDASKHVQELCSPRSAFTPRSASSMSSFASSPARRR